MHVAICGGGVIGAAAAYEMSRRGADVTLIERWRVGGCASGKSGGFLARDWCDGTPVAELARRSFDLHEIWAEQIGNPYGYRKVDTYSTVMHKHAGPQRVGGNGLVAWLSPDAVNQRQIGDHTTTAALDPGAFTNTLMRAAMAQGALLKTATVSGLAKSADETRISGVELESGETVDADAVVLAMGPWSLLAVQWVAIPPVYGLKGNSIIFKPEAALPAAAIFAEVEDASGGIHTPEIVSRADGTIYVCGMPGTGGLPIDPSQVLPGEDGCRKLRQIALRLIPSLDTAAVLEEQACYRPVTADGMPLIGRIAGVDGAYLATGHSVWGMLNAPGTAEALADEILGEAGGLIDLTPFSPARLEPLGPESIEFRSR